jgi:hypothetical protein
LNELDALTRLFARLGARDPESWAAFQLREGIPQLARYLFHRQAWRLVVEDGDETWIREQQAEAQKGNPGSSIGPALQRVLDAGAMPQDVTTIVRVMQWHLLSSLCYLLEDPGALEPEVRHVAWRLFQVTEDDEPIDIIGGLHESVLETDPTRREMGRP